VTVADFVATDKGLQDQVSTNLKAQEADAAATGDKIKKLQTAIDTDLAAAISKLDGKLAASEIKARQHNTTRQRAISSYTWLKFSRFVDVPTRRFISTRQLVHMRVLRAPRGCGAPHVQTSERNRIDRRSWVIAIALATWC